MTDYTKVTDFAAKDALSTGNPAKIVKGTEIDDELVAISGAVASKADKASPTFTGTPAAPTASSGTSTTQIATTAFAMDAAALVSPSGELKMWPTSSAPTGFLICSGAAVSRTIYAALFAVIGTTFGAGDGSTTFNVPNFNNRMPIGAGDLYAAAATGGSKDAIAVSHNHTFSGNTGGQSASHTHGFSINTITGSQDSTTYVAKGNPEGNASVYSGTTGGASNDHSHAYSGTTSNAGSSGTGANLPPYLGVYFIIKT